MLVKNNCRKGKR